MILPCIFFINKCTVTIWVTKWLKTNEKTLFFGLFWRFSPIFSDTEKFSGKRLIFMQCNDLRVCMPNIRNSHFIC